ncbi:hypothetical protein OQA88_91 [Cercophora sp. LCS_1]
MSIGKEPANINPFVAGMVAILVLLTLLAITSCCMCVCCRRTKAEDSVDRRNVRFAAEHRIYTLNKGSGPVFSSPDYKHQTNTESRRTSRGQQIDVEKGGVTQYTKVSTRLSTSASTSAARIVLSTPPIRRLPQTTLERPLLQDVIDHVLPEIARLANQRAAQIQAPPPRSELLREQAASPRPGRPLDVKFPERNLLLAPPARPDPTSLRSSQADQAGWGFPRSHELIKNRVEDLGTLSSTSAEVPEKYKEEVRQLRKQWWDNINQRHISDQKQKRIGDKFEFHATLLGFQKKWHHLFASPLGELEGKQLRSALEDYPKQGMVAITNLISGRLSKRDISPGCCDITETSLSLWDAANNYFKGRYPAMEAGNLLQKGQILGLVNNILDTSWDPRHRQFRMSEAELAANHLDKMV